MPAMSDTRDSGRLVRHRPRLAKDYLRQLRLSLGMSESELAARLNVSLAYVRLLERDQGDARVPLELLLDLCKLYGVELAELLDDAPACQRDRTDDTATLGAYLMSVSRGVGRTEACLDLGWTLRRLNAAVEELQGQLTGAGLRLNATGVLHLAPRERALALGERTSFSRRNNLGIQNPTQARLLYRLTGEAPMLYGRLTSTERTFAARLLAIGMIEISDNVVRPTATFRAALGLDP